MDRRSFMLGSGAGLLTTGSSFAATSKFPDVKLKKNLVLVTVDHGLFEGYYREGKESSQYMNRFFKNFKKKMTYFDGMYQPGVNKGHYSEHATFTALNFQDRAQYSSRQFISLDQYVAEHSVQETRHKSLYHQVSGGRNMSWNAQAQAAPAYIGASSLHENLFGNVDLTLQKKEISKQRVILKELMVNIKRRWRGTPQEKNLYASIKYQMDALETREKWLKVKRPRKSAKFDAGIERSPLLNAHHNFNTIFEALKEKQTKIAMVQFGGGRMPSGLPGISHGYHTLTHHSYYSERVDELSTIDEYVLKNLATFLEQLETEKMLDDTIVLFTCAMADANKHSCKNIPAFLFGGDFKHKPRVECSDSSGELKKPTTMLFSSILKQLGFRDPSFSGNDQVISELFKG
ncbi:MAG: DUF1552 domain-containing protein [Lentisphaeraceae bacterium]|nr:DUF1552 domain-containing protein [Lentisphaeraceae bacterium]